MLFHAACLCFNLRMKKKAQVEQRIRFIPFKSELLSPVKYFLCDEQPGQVRNIRVLEDLKETSFRLRLLLHIFNFAMKVHHFGLVYSKQNII